jgi:hypothetical protein
MLRDGRSSNSKEAEMGRETSTNWTVEEAAAHAARFGLAPPPDKAELQRLCEIGNRVASVGQAIARMPFKGDEPASVFKVPS